MANFRILLVLFAAFTFSSLAQAQATRTWVSGVGDDVNPCSRTAPCKTFAGAISKTAKDGEIDALDPGGFGAVTITRSMTLDGTGTMASILASGTNGIIINITDPVDGSKTVRLRGLSINGAGTGMVGIKVLAANRVIIEDMIIDGFTRNGISFEASSPVQAIVMNSRVSNNAGNGINAAGGAQVVLQNTTLVQNGTGVFAEKSEVTTVDCEVVLNNTGFQAAAGATIRISGVTVTNNNLALAIAAGGSIVSLKNNLIHGNKKDGEAPTPIVMR